MNKEAKEAIARALAVFMSDLSERAWCAGWHMGLEYRLWEIVQGGNPKLGQIEVTPTEIETMVRLADMIGGWVMWDEDGPEETKLVPFAQWEQEYSHFWR